MAERIDRLEAAGVEKETARQETIDRLTADAERAVTSLQAERTALEKARNGLAATEAETDRALTAMQAESEAAARKLLRMEKDQAAALADAFKREDALRLALETERRRAEQLEKDAAAREASTSARSRSACISASFRFKASLSDWTSARPSSAS